MRAIYGKKLMMTRLFDGDGKVVPVTVIETNPNTVTFVKEAQKDGYDAVQFGFGNRRHLNKPLRGHLASLKKNFRQLYEVKTDQSFKIGDEITLEILKEGEKVNVTGISKGKGFQGTVKRHHFNTGPRTHGSNNYRQPGSIGSTFPQRVVKGRRMAGQMGNEQITTQNLTVFKIDTEKNHLYIKGAVPGPNRAYVKIWSKVKVNPEKGSDEA